MSADAAGQGATEGSRRLRKRPTIRDVAKGAGVSPALVSFALNDRRGVSPETKARILAEAEQLGYRADPVARALRTGRSALYAILVRNLRNPYFADVIAGVQEAAHAAYADVLIADADDSPEREARHVESLAAQRIEGLAIAPVSSGAVATRWRTLRPGVRTVVINATAPAKHDLAEVSPDHREAVRQGVGHLAELGHRRVGFLTAPAAAIADHRRLDTFLREAPKHGVTPQPLETVPTHAAVHEGVLAALRTPDRPTAVITSSDVTAHAVYTAARACGTRIGADLSVVGHDDLPTSALLDPPMTTLRVDARAIGRATFARLTGSAEAPVHREPVELVVRASTGPCLSQPAGRAADSERAR